MNKDNIITTEELRQCIGRPVVCYYYDDWSVDRGDVQRPNRDEKYILFKWMFVLTEINTNYRFRVRDVVLKGNCIVILTDKRGIVPRLLRKEGSSTAQSYVRLPTKDELKIYNKFYRHKQI